VTPEEYNEMEELRRAHALMAEQFKIMQQEKEHGWNEAARWEVRADRLASENAVLRDRNALSAKAHRLLVELLDGDPDWEYADVRNEIAERLTDSRRA
jgi:hypothetical protein